MNFNGNYAGGWDGGPGFVCPPGYQSPYRGPPPPHGPPPPGQHAGACNGPPPPPYSAGWLDPQTTIVSDVVLPYIGPLPHLVDGTIITIQGSVPNAAKSFSINFQVKSGRTGDGDTALHINPRFLNNCVVRNSFLNKRWGTEEKVGGLPLQKGAEFQCCITVLKSRYRVMFNGVHHCEYNHRVPLEEVRFLSIEGDVNINTIYVNDPAAPVQSPGDQFTKPPHPPLGRQDSATSLHYSAPVPFRELIPGGFVNNKRVIIEGMPRASQPHGFSVNFCYFNNMDRDIALHFNPRFYQSKVVRNTRQGHKWGREEKGQGFPFAVGTPFQIQILCFNEKYKVLVNGTEFTDYMHRLRNLEHIMYLIIEGDVQLSNVVIQ